MPQLHFAKARNDIYAEGLKTKADNKQGYTRDRSKPANKQDKILVKKGESYYWWQFPYRDKSISLTRPKRSQLTQSGFLSALYDIEDNLSGLNAGDFESVEDLESTIDDIKSEVESLRDEQEEKKSNMPEQLQESQTGETLQERYDALDSMYSELDGIDFSYDAPDEEEFKTEIIDELGYSEIDDLSDAQLQEIEDKLQEKLQGHKEDRINEIIEEIHAISSGL